MPTDRFSRSLTRLRRFALGATLCLMTVYTLASCALPGTGAAATPTPDPDLAALKGFPAYALQYPGAVLLASGEAPRQPGLLGTNGAEVAKTFGIHAPVPKAVNSQAILDWYNQPLRDQGWMRDETGSALYLAQQSWRQAPRYHIRVGFFTPTALRQLHPEIDPAAYPLVFEVEIFVLAFVDHR